MDNLAVCILLCVVYGQVQQHSPRGSPPMGVLLSQSHKSELSLMNLTLMNQDIHQKSNYKYILMLSLNH